MQNLPIYQVDAFTNRLFAGNPAAVVPLPEFLSDELMQSIAAENNLSETAFVTVHGPGQFAIRWFTPTAEVRLCGHATLAAAHVMYHSSDKKLVDMSFRTKSGVGLQVKVLGNSRYQLDFPVDPPRKIPQSQRWRDIVGVKRIVGLYRGQDDAMMILQSEKQIANLKIDFALLSQMTKYRGLIVSAPGRKADFVSRCFFPQTGVNEDPVTGSAHTLLTPYWATRLGRKKLKARQLSGRGGQLNCQLRGTTVRLIGGAVTYLSGQMMLEHLSE